MHKSFINITILLSWVIVLCSSWLTIAGPYKNGRDNVIAESHPAHTTVSLLMFLFEEGEACEGFEEKGNHLNQRAIFSSPEFICLDYIDDHTTICKLSECNSRILKHCDSFALLTCLRSVLIRV